MRKAVLAAALLSLPSWAWARDRDGRSDHNNNSYNNYNNYNTNYYAPPPPDPALTKVQGAKQSFDYTLWSAQSKQNEIKTAEDQVKSAQDAKGRGQAKVWQQDGYYWNEVPVDEAIDKGQEKVDQKQKEQDELKAKAEEVATDYVESEGAYKDKFGANYSPDTLNTANEIVQQAASVRAQARRAAEEEQRLAQLEKDEKAKEAAKGKNQIKIPTLGMGKAVDNIEIDPAKMGQRPTESPSLLAQAPASELKGGGPRPLPHDLKPISDQGTVGRIEAPGAARRAGPLDPSLADGKPVGSIEGAQAQEASSDPAKAREALAAAKKAFQSGDFKKAAQLAEEAARQDPKDAEAQVLRSKALGRLRDFYGAEEAARKALELRPDDPEALRALAWSLLHSGKYREAAEAASRALALDPNDAEALALRAFAYEKLGDKGRMLDDLSRAAQLAPERYGRLVKKARAGQTVFDPSDDSDLLMETVASASRSGRVPLAAAVLALAALAGGWALWNRRSAAAAAPAAAPAAAAPQASSPAWKYELKEAMGEGAWKAWDPTLGRPLFIRRAAARKTDLRALAALNHPNIEEIYEVVEREDGLYVVSEWLEGKTLEERLSEGPLGPGMTKDVLGPVFQALAQAHEKGVAHGALAFKRVLLGRHGQVKLLGFGSKGEGEVSRDLLALAACARELVVERAPALDALLAQAQDPDPLKRPRSAAEFWKALAPLL